MPEAQGPLRFYAAIDGLALDIVAARHMGMRDPRESSMLRAAHHWFGAGDLADGRRPGWAIAVEEPCITSSRHF